jgi:hypothetical protein
MARKTAFVAERLFMEQTAQEFPDLPLAATKDAYTRFRQSVIYRPRAVKQIQNDLLQQAGAAFPLVPPDHQTA